MDSRVRRASSAHRTPSPRRSAPRSASHTSNGARDLLLNAAERLFGRNGIAGVSLREVAAAAGQRNNSAVHYYFRDKRGLVDALIADRIGNAERQRQILIDRLGDLASCDSAALLRLLWQPLLELDSGQGDHPFIQFYLSYQTQRAGSSHPLISDPDRYPASGRILAELAARSAHISHEQFQYRLGLMAMMFWAAVSWHDNSLVATNQRWSSRFSIEETINLTVAALAAPI